MEPCATTSVRTQAYWIKRPAFGKDDYVYYRRHDGTLYRGNTNLSESTHEPVYTSSLFLKASPLKVYFDFTNRCNLACLHCITSSSPNIDTSAELPTTRIIDLINELAEIGVLEIAVGGGEPLLHPDWPMLLQYITASGVNLIITTNGLRLTEHTVSLLQNIQPLEVRVSFDGGPTFHEHVRGKNTYTRALHGLSQLIHAGLRATARLTLCQGVEVELPLLFADLAQIGVQTVKVAVVKEAGRAATSTGKHLLGYEVEQQTVASLFSLGDTYHLHVQLSADDFPVSVIDAHDPKLRDMERPNCGAGFETCYISPHGEILGCVVMPTLGFGSLHTNSFREVWHSKLAQAYRRVAMTSNKRRLCDGLCTRSGLQSTPPSGIKSIALVQR